MLGAPPLGVPDGAATVTRLLRAQNAEKETPDRKCVLSEEEHIQAVEMEAAGVACIVGYYHSHTDGSIGPSPRDLALAVEGTVYLIAGIGHGRARAVQPPVSEGPRAARYAAWRLEGNELVAEPLEEVNE